MLIDKQLSLGNFMFYLMAHRYHEARITKTGIYCTIEVAIGLFDYKHFSIFNPSKNKSLHRVFVLSDFLLNRKLKFHSEIEKK